MRIDAQVLGMDQLREAMKVSETQARFAAAMSLNEAAAPGMDAVRRVMPSVFDRPTPWVVNSLRLKRATKANLVAEVAFKDRNSAENSRTMVMPHVDGGKRRFKAMEARLFRAGYLPAGWNAVPGGGAKVDAFGNMSAGQITQMLNVLGTYTEAGYNKANDKTVERLAKGNAKKGVYGFKYWVNPIGGGVGKHTQAGSRHLPPGVYQRVATPFGSSLKPVLIFVRRAVYTKRLDFYGIVGPAALKAYPALIEVNFANAMRSAIPRHQGSLL